MEGELSHGGMLLGPRKSRTRPTSRTDRISPSPEYCGFILSVMGSMVSGLVLLTTVSLSGADGFWQPLALKYKLGYQSATPATRYSYSRKYDTWCKGLVPD